MEQDNYHSLCRICPPGMERKLSLFLDFAPELRRREVPDPCYGRQRWFDQVLDMVETVARGLLSHLTRRGL